MRPFWVFWTCGIARAGTYYVVGEILIKNIDFSWKNRDTGWGTESPADIGLIAQEVEKDFPSLVGKMGDGYKGIRYDRLVPVLVDSIKTQDKKIEKLEGLVKKLINELEEE